MASIADTSASSSRARLGQHAQRQLVDRDKVPLVGGSIGRGPLQQPVDVESRGSARMQSGPVAISARIGLRAWPRPLRADARATRNTRMASTFPSWSWPHRWHHHPGPPGRPRWRPGGRTCRAGDGADGWAGQTSTTFTPREEVAGEPGAVGTGSLDSEQVDLAEALQPGQQLPVALGRRRERLAPRSPPRSSKAAATCTSRWVSTPPVICRVKVVIVIFAHAGWDGTAPSGTMDRTATGLCGRLL